MNLQQASQCLFLRSQRGLATALFAGVGVLATSVLSLFAENPWADLVLILLIAALEMIQVLAKFQGLRRFALADCLRRMHQLEDGLGITPDPLKVSDAERIVGFCDAEPVSSYWRTRLPQGPYRLVEMIEESAFFTDALSETCAKLLRSFAFCGIAMCVVLLIAAVRIGISGPVSEIASHVIVATLVFFLAGDSILLAYQYFDLKGAARTTLQRALFLLSKEDLSEAEALGFVMEYNSAVSQAPPIISYIYEKRRKQLDALFIRYKEAQCERPGCRR